MTKGRYTQLNDVILTSPDSELWIDIRRYQDEPEDFVRLLDGKARTVLITADITIDDSFGLADLRNVTFVVKNNHTLTIAYPGTYECDFIIETSGQLVIAFDCVMTGQITLQQNARNAISYGVGTETVTFSGTISDIRLSSFADLPTAIKVALQFGRSLIIDRPINIGGATVDCQGVGLTWLGDGNVISNGTLNIDNCVITAGRYDLFDGTLTTTGTPVLNPVEDYDTGTKHYIDGLNNENVKLTGNQTIAGIKSFSSFPVTPSSAPSADYQIANKKYIDDAFAIASHQIGEIFAMSFGTPVNESPDVEYIVLTAGETGAGGYNEGLLESESVSGTAPNIVATADIAVGPLAGQTINLINTEGRFVRPGETAGQLQESQNKEHTHTGTALEAGAHRHTYDKTKVMSWQSAGGTVWMIYVHSDYTTSQYTSQSGAHTHTISIDNQGGDEARPRNISATYYMRIV